MANLKRVPEDILIPAGINKVDEGRHETPQRFQSPSPGAKEAVASPGNYAHSVLEVVQKAIDEERLLDQADNPILVSGGSQASVQFQDEGVDLGTSGTVSTIDFVGSGVTATRASNKVTVTVNTGSGANLTYTAAPTQGTVLSDTGTDAVLPAVNSTNAGLMLPGDKDKIDFVTITQAVDLDALEAQAHDALTVVDGTTIDFTLTGQQLTAERKALTGDVTASQGSNTTVIANDVVTNAKLANMAGDTIKGRLSSLGDPQDLSASQVKTLLAYTASEVTNVAAGTISSTTVQNALNELDTEKQQDIQFQDEGSNIGTSGGTSVVNFTGAGVTASESSGVVTVNISSGAYTDEEAQDAVGTILTDSSTIDFTYDDGTPSITATVINDSITYAKLQNASAGNVVLTRANSASGDYGETALSGSQLLGRGSTGDIAAITLGSGLSMSGTTLSASAVADTIGTDNGATFRYQVLTGTPTVTYDTSTATAPVLTVSGGTIKLKELWVPYTSGGSTDPIWTINGTVSASRFISTPIVTKIIENSTTPSIAGTYNQADIDNTPQVRYGDYTATSVNVQIAAVTGAWNFGFHFTMNE